MDLEWILGVDLRARSRGALRFAGWLFDRAQPPKPKITALYVGIGESDARAPEAVARARAETDALGVTHALAGIDVVADDEPADKLARLATMTASGIIIGRAGRSQGWSLVNLGPVARRLLRRVPTPLCVVPPDLESIDEGPVLVAVSDDPSCTAAAAFAIALAHKISRGVTALYVAPDPTPVPVFAGEPGLPAPIDAGLLTELRDAASHRVQRWIDEGLLTELTPPRIEIGDPAPAIARTAAELHASIIVCGSRRLSVADRVLQSSVGTDLAAHADRPVIVVPPDFPLERPPTS